MTIAISSASPPEAIAFSEKTAEGWDKRFINWQNQVINPAVFQLRSDAGLGIPGTGARENELTGSFCFGAPDKPSFHSPLLCWIKELENNAVVFLGQHF